MDDDLTTTTKNYNVIISDDKYETFKELDKKIKGFKENDKEKKTKKVKKLKLILEDSKDYENQRYKFKKLLNNIDMRSDKLHIIHILESKKTFEEKYDLIEKILIQKIFDSSSKSLIKKKYLERLINELIRHNQLRKFITIDNKYLKFINKYSEKENQILYDQVTLIEKLSKENIKNLHNLDSITDNIYINKNKTSETTQPDNLYMLDYSDGYSFDKIKLDFNIETKKNNRIENKNNEVNDNTCGKGKKCDRNYRCDYNQDPPKCIPKEEFLIKVKKKIKNKDNTTRKKEGQKNEKGTKKRGRPRKE